MLFGYYKLLGYLNWPQSKCLLGFYRGLGVTSEKSGVWAYTPRKLPSNRLETLGGSRNGQYSIRINAQWRVCFEWPENAERPFNIEIVDYH